MWCTIHYEGVLDSYFSDNEIVRKQDHSELLDSFVRSEAENFPGNISFQQDGAPPRTSLAAQSLSADILIQNWIEEYRPTNWTARSPDLTPPDFSCNDILKIKYLRLQCKNKMQFKNNYESNKKCDT